MDDLLTRTTASLRRIGQSSRVSRVSNSLQQYSGGSGRGLFNQSDSDLPEATGAYEAMGAVGTLFAIVNQLSVATARNKWRLFPRTIERDLEQRDEIINHGFLRVWNNPNDHYTGRLFRETLQQHMDLVGEAIIVLYRYGSLIYEMWPVRPDRFHPIKHPDKFIIGYMYVAPDGEEVPLRLEDVIHIKMPNPSDPYRGLGPVQSVLMDIDAARYGTQWNRNFFVNGARPGGIIKVDYRMQDNELQDFIARWQRQHRGVANAHRVAVLENAEWVDTKFSMEDMQFVELRNLPRELIREAFAFPKPALGTVDDVNRANAAAGKEMLAEFHIIPRLDRIKDIVDAKLLPQFANGGMYELNYDDPRPVNREDQDRERNSQADAASKLVTAGYHPDDVCDAMGLPRMRWIGPPSAQPAPSGQQPMRVPSNRSDYDHALPSITAMHSAGC